jgi:hypothetical protein
LGRELIPSRRPLLDGLEEKIMRLEKAGIHSLHALLAYLNDRRRIEELSDLTGIELTYLNLLRREVNSYFPNPVSLNRFPGIDPAAVAILAERGLKNSRHLFERIASDPDLAALSREAGIKEEMLQELRGLSDLARAYGVGPVFARMLYDIGIHSLKELGEYSPQEVILLYEKQTGKKADFTISDLSFSLALIHILDPK